MARRIPRILLVEPDDVLAEVTAFRLELLGYHVETVTNAEEANRSASADTPDLIITDLMLGSVDAVGLLEMLNRQMGTSAIPIMVLSVDADLDRVAAAHRAGACDFLVVPYQPEVLHEKVARLLTREVKKAGEKEKAKVPAG